MSKIFITGDTHLNIDINKLNEKTFEKETGVLFDDITKNDYLIVCGDFGLIWYPDKYNINEKIMTHFYENKPWTTLFIDGNHENFNRLTTFPEEEWHGGTIHRISDSIIHLTRGQIFNIDNIRFFTMGGATSIDRAFRIKNETWWPQEIPSEKEYQTALNNLQKNNYEIDYIITHCCSTTYQKNLVDNTTPIIDELNTFFESLEFEKKIRFRHWYFGHYHADKDIDTKHTCLYNKIIQI